MNVKGIIFDMDGVIFDSESLWRDGFIRGNAEFGVTLSETFRQSICGKSETDIRDEIRALIPSLDVDTYRDYIIDHVRIEIENGRFDLKPHAVEIIDYLRAKEYKIALATSSFRNRAVSMFREKGMDLFEIFDAYSFLEDVGAMSKPNPYIFKITADKMGVDYDECVVVEDSINGIHAAVNGGMIPIHVRDLIPPDDFVREHAVALLTDLIELKDIL